LIGPVDVGVGAVEIRRVVIGFKEAELRRARAGLGQHDVTHVTGLVFDTLGARIHRRRAVGLVQSPVSHGLCVEHLQVKGFLLRIVEARFVANAVGARAPARSREVGQRPRGVVRGIGRDAIDDRGIAGDERRVADQHLDAVGDIGKLRRELRRELRGDGAVRVRQREVFAGGVELEVRVQRRARHAAVLARGEHDHEAAGGEVGRGEEPLRGIARAVAQSPVEQVDAGARRVLDLDPVGGVAILVIQRLGVARHELGDAHLGRSGKGRRSE